MKKSWFLGFLIFALFLSVLSLNSVKGQEVEWEKTFAGAEGYSAKQTTDGGYIVVGTRAGDIYLIKTDANGNRQWEKTFGTFGFRANLDYGRDVQETGNGYIIVGYSGDSGVYNVTLIKTDANGNRQWERTFGGPDTDFGYSVQLTKDGGYIISGFTFFTLSDNYDAYLIKTDANGNTLWEKTFNTGTHDFSYSVRETTDGGYIITGNDVMDNPEVDSSVLLLKTDIDGNLMWNKTFGGTGSDVGYSVFQTNDGGYIIIGKTSSIGFGNYDAYLIKTDRNGNKEWEKTFGGQLPDVGFSGQQTSDMGYIISGYSNSFAPQDGFDDSDGYLIKTNADGNILWNITFGGDRDDYGRFVIQTREGSYIVTGNIFRDILLMKIKEGQSTPSCINRIKDGTETDIDCGGSCPVCGNDKSCLANTDCQSNYCNPNNKCSYPSCTDGWKNGGESDIDCGGNCDKCLNGKNCSSHTECQSNYCNPNKICAIPTCNDGEKNQDETDVDCGGTCGSCSDGKSCSINSNCQSTYCNPNNICSTPSCTDGFKNQDETDVDCGGSCERKCDVRQSCLIDNDCQSNYCYFDEFNQVKICWIRPIPSCSDRIKNQDETDVDCGGGICPACSNNLGCLVNLDCQSSYCDPNKICANPSCIDGWKNGQETDIDCGGICRRCYDGTGCLIDSDCFSNYCTPNNICSYPTCFDGWKNGDETDVDCGGRCLLCRDIQWQRNFGGSSNDFGFSAQQTIDGGYIVAGSMASDETGFDVYLIKTDINGDKEWEKTFGSNVFDYSYSVQQTFDEGYIVTGYTDSGLGRDVYLIKTDKNGSLVWQRNFGSGDTEVGNFVQQTNDKGYIIVGSTSPIDRGDADVYVIKTNKYSSKEWSSTFGGIGLDYGYAIQQITDGGYIIVGSSTGSFTPSSDVYLIKIDQDGNKVWEKIFDGGDNFVVGTSVKQTSDKGFIIAGYNDSLGAGTDVYLIKTDAEGNKLWERTFGGSGDDSANSILETRDGYVIVGETESFGNSLQIYLIKTDINGDKEWEKAIGGSGPEYGKSIQQTNDGSYIIAGSLGWESAGNSDVLLIKYGKEQPNCTNGVKDVGESDIDCGGACPSTCSDEKTCLTNTDCQSNYCDPNKFCSIPLCFDGWKNGDEESIDCGGSCSVCPREWQGTFGGRNNDLGRSVSQTTDGGYILAGDTSSFGNGNTDVYLIKTDKYGRTVWENTLEDQQGKMHFQCSRHQMTDILLQVQQHCLEATRRNI